MFLCLAGVEKLAKQLYEQIFQIKNDVMFALYLDNCKCKHKDTLAVGTNNFFSRFNSSNITATLTLTNNKTLTADE